MIKVTDELLYRYMPLVDDIIRRHHPLNVPEQHVFSQNFKARMERLCRFSERPGMHFAFLRTGRKVAVIVLIAAVTGASITMSIPQARERFLTIIRSTSPGKTYDDIMFSDVSEGQEQYAEPGWIPPGYQIVEDIAEEDERSLLMETDSGDSLGFVQWKISETDGVALNNELEDMEVIIIGGDEIHIGRQSGTETQWEAQWFHRNVLCILGGSNITKREMIKIIKNLNYLSESSY